VRRLHYRLPTMSDTLGQRLLCHRPTTIDTPEQRLLRRRRTTSNMHVQPLLRRHPTTRHTQEQLPQRLRSSTSKCTRVPCLQRHHFRTTRELLRLLLRSNTAPMIAALVRLRIRCNWTTAAAHHLLRTSTNQKRSSTRLLLHHRHIASHTTRVEHRHLLRPSMMATRHQSHRRLAHKDTPKTTSHRHPSQPQ
jgi:hypothetical protein